ncbi:hypothetical protein ABGN05_21285 [Aquibium sp. LZ166]|uniref:Uncharacterized protein n=1 Tax=Aquibium pacificus TaxID=3153579 RepID=A0ABV3SNB0_9HYPH
MNSPISHDRAGRLVFATTIEKLNPKITTIRVTMADLRASMGVLLLRSRFRTIALNRS